MKALALDGPLAGEVWDVPDPPPPIWRVPLPPRVTICLCDDYEDEFETAAQVFEYHAVSRGRAVVLYSKHREDEEAIIKAIREWVFTDIGRVDRLVAYCREKRAFQ